MKGKTVVLGWDIGGVNTKVACIGDDGTLAVRSRAFELQRDPDALVRVLSELAAEVGVASGSFICAVTMTAELSQMFRTKRGGVHFVLDAVEAAFPRADIRVFTVSGDFIPPSAARERAISVAAANWAATAHLVARHHRNAVLVDVGTTTTDVIPIVDGEVAAVGTTDPERLASGELVYSGALRTPVEAIVLQVPYRDGTAGVSAEGFALVGDVHLWRGRLAPEDYTVPTPDGREVTREFAGERLARIICADRELLDEGGITRIADAVAAEQTAAIAAAITRVASRHPAIQTAAVTGLGTFIASDAARMAGFDVVSLAGDIGEDAARYAPAAAVALLVADGPAKAGPHDVVRRVRFQTNQTGPAKARSHDADRIVDLVIKVGGGLLAHVEDLDRVLRAIADVARARKVLIVPGGGLFADAVRRVDERLGLDDSEAHWMAILAMDQSAHLLASRVAQGAVVSTSEEIEAARRSGRTPVLAPSRWLSAEDPLPHTWDVTSDSIAAWVAGELRAPHLLLIKPPRAGGPGLVDAYFERTLPPFITHHCLAADAAIELLNQMAGRVDAAVETT